MAKIRLTSLLSVLIPLVLLIAFALAITFPTQLISYVITPKSYDGLGTETHELEIQDPSGKPVTVSFDLKRVPSGVAPGLCTDEPDATVVDKPFRLAETEVTGALWDAVRASPA